MPNLAVDAAWRGRRGDLLGLSAALFVCFATAALGGAFTAAGLGPWYDGLAKPAWRPPDAAFGPVWTALFALMAVAAWLVGRERAHPGRRAALAWFATQLALNAAWSWLFFTLRSPGAALAEIGLLWAAILGTVVVCGRVRPAAGVLLLPYLAWVTFAAALNLAIWRLNP
jgi:tryptophan-rich sensory protein